MIARHLAVLCLMYAALTLQPGLGPETNAVQFRLWLPAVVLVAGVILLRGTASLFWAGVLGLSIDCLAGGRLGVNMVIATIVAAGINSLWTTDRDWPGLLTVEMSLFLATVLWRSGAALVDSAIDRRFLPLTSLIQPALVEAASTAVFVVVALLPVQLGIWLRRPQDGPAVLLANRWTMLTGG